MKHNWLGPALALLGLGAVGAWVLNDRNKSLKVGDYAAINPAALAPPIGLPFQVPQNSRLVVRVDTVGPGGIAGYVVGYVDPNSGQVFMPAGGAGGIPTSGLPAASVVGIYRGNPLKQIA